MFVILSPLKPKEARGLQRRETVCDLGQNDLERESPTYKTRRIWRPQPAVLRPSGLQQGCSSALLLEAPKSVPKW